MHGIAATFGLGRRQHVRRAVDRHGHPLLPLLHPLVSWMRTTCENPSPAMVIGANAVQSIIGRIVSRLSSCHTTDLRRRTSILDDPRSSRLQTGTTRAEVRNTLVTCSHAI